MIDSTDDKRDERELYVVEARNPFFGDRHEPDTEECHRDRASAEDVLNEYSPRTEARIVRYVPESALLRAKLDVLDELEREALQRAQRDYRSVTTVADWTYAHDALRRQLSTSDAERGGKAGKDV
jgi:hypothetical protein